MCGSCLHKQVPETVSSVRVTERKPTKPQKYFEILSVDNEIMCKCSYIHLTLFFFFFKLSLVG